MLLIFLAAMIPFSALYIFRHWAHDIYLIQNTLPFAIPKTSQDTLEQTITALPNGHLFGSVQSHIESAPISQLPIRITGIVQIIDRHAHVASKAYLSVNGERDHLYQVGDRLQNGVMVYEVTKDTVIFENHGRLEKIVLQRSMGGSE
ncbi:MAG: hypothetical protein A3F43_02675 [Gammaproteobacteria bacterium RIFCSPHIGHO2_12_FULL_42_10]|nr:MAG: hypothetical protein A3F43_02675 [Gammaproteobacteria bacterium RIFCSPHIGHO2_12_FULL_42_10]